MKWFNQAFVYAFIIQQFTFRSSLASQPHLSSFLERENIPGSRKALLVASAPSTLEAQLVAASYLRDPGADLGFSKKGSWYMTMECALGGRYRGGMYYVGECGRATGVSLPARSVDYNNFN